MEHTPRRRIRSTGPARPGPVLRVARAARGRRSGRARTTPSRPGSPRTAPATLRRTGRIRAGSTPLHPPVPRSRVVVQTAVLGVVLCAVAFVLAVPLRNYHAQQDQLRATLAQEQATRNSITALQQQQAALSDPAYIESEAKRRLQFVKPGDTVYVVTAPTLPVPRPAVTAPPAATSPWYADLWNTLSDPVQVVRPGTSGPPGR